MDEILRRAQLKMAERQQGDVTILTLEGNLTHGEGTAALRREVRGLLEEGRRKLVFDFSHVRYVDSSGLGELVSAKVAADRVGGQIKLIGVGRNFRDILLLTKLVTVFDLHDSELAALNDFS